MPRGGFNSYTCTCFIYLTHVDDLIAAHRSGWSADSVFTIPLLSTSLRDPDRGMHLTRLPLFLDSLCVADSFSPDRFDLQSSQAPYGLDLVARSVLLSSTARDVGALAPPARAEASRGRSTEDIREGLDAWRPRPMRVGEKFLHFFAPPQEHRLG